METTKLPKIGYDKVTSRRKVVKSHTHAYYELYYLIKGETAYFVGDDIYNLSPGDFIIVPKGAIHSTDSQNCLHNERLLVCFDDCIFDERTLPYLRDLCKARLIRIKESCAHIPEQVLQKLCEEEDITRPLGNLYVIELILLLSRHKKEGIERKEGDGTIEKIAAYIRENYAEPLSLASVSSKFGMSECNLSRQFKKEVGIGLWEFITQVRIYNAERILSEGSVTVTKAAELCGFSDSNYFSTVFKKAKGITPLKYKKLQL